MKFEIWDCPGFERFCYVGSTVCGGAHAVILVYDKTQRNSLRNARRWLHELPGAFIPDIFKALVGNKADLVSCREVTYEVICVSIGLRQA